MTTVWFCDECEARLMGAALDFLMSPAFVTNGDHYWCEVCWEDRQKGQRLCEVIDCDSIATIVDADGRYVCTYHGDE